MFFTGSKETSTSYLLVYCFIMLVWKCVKFCILTPILLENQVHLVYHRQHCIILPSFSISYYILGLKRGLKSKKIIIIKKNRQTDRRIYMYVYKYVNVHFSCYAKSVSNVGEVVNNVWISGVLPQLFRRML